MENEIKVNEFVRTKDGQIYKIEDGTEFYEDSNKGTIYKYGI